MAPGYLTTAHAASILYVEPANIRRTIHRVPNIFRRTLKFGNRWAVAASDLHKIISTLDGDSREEMVANAAFFYIMTGGNIPDLDFWLDDHVHLKMSILHRRVDYRSGCECGQGLDDIDPDLVETEKFNYLFEPGVTVPVTPFDFELEEL